MPESQKEPEIANEKNPGKLKQDQKKQSEKFLIFILLGFGKPKIPHLPTLGGEVKQPRKYILNKQWIDFNIIMIYINKNSRSKKYDAKKKLEYPNVTIKRGTTHISKNKKKPNKAKDTDTKPKPEKDKRQNKQLKEYPLLIKGIENAEVLRNEAVLFEIISDCAPEAVNAFVTRWDSLVIIFT